METTHARDWSGLAIAHWFAECHVKKASSVQGCEGLALPLTHGGYVWMEVFVDLDYQWAALLDVRTVSEDDGEEYRDYLIVCVNGHKTEAEWVNKPVRCWDDSVGRLVEGMSRLAGAVEDFLVRQGHRP